MENANREYANREYAALGTPAGRIDHSATLKRGELSVGRKLLRQAARARRIGREPRPLNEVEQRCLVLALDQDAADLSRRAREL